MGKGGCMWDSAPADDGADYARKPYWRVKIQRRERGWLHAAVLCCGRCQHVNRSLIQRLISFTVSPARRRAALLRCCSQVNTQEPARPCRLHHITGAPDGLDADRDCASHHSNDLVLCRSGWANACLGSAALNLVPRHRRLFRRQIATPSRAVPGCCSPAHCWLLSCARQRPPLPDSQLAAVPAVPRRATAVVERSPTRKALCSSPYTRLQSVRARW